MRGDHVVAIDGQPVSRFSRAAIYDFVLALRPTQLVKIGVERTGEPLEMALEAVKLPEERRQGREMLLRLREELEREPPRPQTHR